jgi:hypothetical protein
MPKAGFIVARVSVLVLAASMLGVAGLAAPAAGTTSTCSSTAKCFFAVSVSPPSPAAGTNTSFAFTIKNEASPQQLGSVQVSAPTGFMITGASVPPGASGTASFTSGSALFLNLNVAPGASTTLTVNATVPCGSSSYTWGIAAKQSNQFNGTGNNFQLDPASAVNLSGTATGSGSCVSTPCPPSASCTASASSATMSATVTSTAPLPPGDSIVVGIDSVNSSFNYQCPTYTSVADVFSVGVFDANGVPQPILLNGTLRIDKSVVGTSGHPGASSWQICYASPTQFPALPGTAQQGVTIGGTPGYFTGLLPDCSSTQGAPCVQSRNKNNAGDVIITLLAFGDPVWHP